MAYLLPDEVVRLVWEMPDMDPSFTNGLPDTNGNVFEQVDSNLEHIFQFAPLQSRTISNFPNDENGLAEASGTG